MPLPRRDRKLHISVSPWMSSRNAPNTVARPSSTTQQQSEESSEVSGRELAVAESESAVPTDPDTRLLGFNLSLQDQKDVQDFYGMCAIAEFDGRQRCCGHMISQTHTLSLSGAVVMERVECQQSEDWAMLRICLHNHSNGASVELLAERSEGDFLQLCTPSDPSLLPIGGFSDDISHMPRMTFEPTSLKTMDEARDFFARYYPNQDSPLDPSVSLGRVRVTGLPSSLLANGDQAGKATSREKLF